MANFISKIQTKITLILALLLAVSVTGCNDDDDQVINPLPKKIQEFISEYYPGETVASYVTSPNGDITVNLFNSASFIFDKSYDWIEVTGHGNTLPQQLLYDQLPTMLYEYLQSGNALEEVYAISRNANVYTINLANGVISYDATNDKFGDLTE